MRCLLPLALCAVVVFSGCAARKPVASKAPEVRAPIAVGKSNRFEMTQNGQKMSARDFDTWMKARGVRIAKGPRTVKAPPKPRSKRR
jgi:hypothetical protein